jgi:molecular chaperone DnaK
MAADNKTLGTFILSGIAPAPRGIPQVEVSFDIDANGILKVSAKDKATGKEANITITASSGLSKDEVEKMKQDAEVHAQEDAKKKDLIEIKNNSETTIYQTEKLIAENKDKIPAEVITEVTAKMDELKKVKDGEDLEAIKKAFEDFNQTVQKIGAAMYQAQAAPAAGGAEQAPAGEQPSEAGTTEQPSSASSESKPIEADFEKVKEDQPESK